MDFFISQRKEEINDNMFLVFNVFGIVDIIAAVLIFFGEIPGPATLLKFIMIALLFKGFISIVPIPFVIGGVTPIFGFIDITAGLLLFFGNIPGPNLLKLIILIILLIKGFISTLELVKFIG